MPDVVLSSIVEHLHLEAKYDGYRAAELCEERIDDAYRAYGELLNASPDNIGIMENATDAYSRALSSIPVGHGDTILTTENDYVSNQLMFLSLSDRQNVAVRRIPEAAEGGFCPDEANRMIREIEPRIVAITHVPTNSGLVQPVEAIAESCRQVGACFIVDACQSIGQMALDVAEIGCDFLSASSRKFLRGPRGSGVLYVSDRILDEGLAPLYLDMRGGRWTSADDYSLAGNAQRFETWEYPYALVAGSATAVRYALDIGIPAIEDYISSTAEQIRDRLNEIDRIEVLDRGRRKCGIVTFSIPGLDSLEALSFLRNQGIAASISYREYATIDFDSKDVPWAVRVAPHCYTNAEDLDRLYAAVRELVGRRSNGA